MNELKFSAPCLFGLESVLSGELKRMGADNIASENGRVTFTGIKSVISYRVSFKKSKFVISSAFSRDIEVFSTLVV